MKLKTFFRLFGTFFVSEQPIKRITGNSELIRSKAKYVAVIGCRCEKDISNAVNAIREAIERGVDIRLLLNIQEENHKTVEHLITLGCKVRHYPGQGFILALADGEKIRLELNVLDGSHERLGLCLSNSVLAEKLEAYFNRLWNNSISFDEIKKRGQHFDLTDKGAI